MPSARTIKQQLKLRIDRGEFSTRQDLLDYGAEQGWTLWRNGQNYLTFGDERWTGRQKRARVYVEFGDEADFPKAKVRKSIPLTPYYKNGYLRREPFSTDGLDIRWVYILFARSGAETAAYIGQASRMSRRLKDHLRNRREEKGSGPLQSWAAGQGAQLKLVIAESIAGGLGKAEATRQATYLEGLWTERARLNGVLLPGVAGWGQFPPQPADPEFTRAWSEALKAAQPISRILAGELDFGDVCVSGASFDAIHDDFLRILRNG